MLKKILEKELGEVTNEELQFAKQGVKDERQMKGLVFTQKGERLDLLAHYILFYRRYIA